MKWKKIASLLLITALFLSFLGCGERAQPESTAPDDSALLQMRQYQSSMEAFQSDCTQQIHAFTASLQSGDTEAGNAAADTLTTRLAGFEKNPGSKRLPGNSALLCKGKEENGYDICSDDPDFGGWAIYQR